jgi:hypothetical protein
MSFIEEYLIINTEDKLNKKIVQMLVDFSESRSQSTGLSTKRRRNGVFINSEDIPMDLEEIENITSEEEI